MVTQRLLDVERAGRAAAEARVAQLTAQNVQLRAALPPGVDISEDEPAEGRCPGSCAYLLLITVQSMHSHPRLYISTLLTPCADDAGAAAAADAGAASNSGTSTPAGGDQAVASAGSDGEDADAQDTTTVSLMQKKHESAEQVPERAPEV
jgi:hypothetical protein